MRRPAATATAERRQIVEALRREAAEFEARKSSLPSIRGADEAVARVARAYADRIARGDL